MLEFSSSLLAASDKGVAEAAKTLQHGGLVAFPTETVYGLGADATNGRAVARVFEAKGRPSFNPLIVHVPDIEAALGIGAFGPAAERFAHAFWPGALTLVVPLLPKTGLSDLVTAGLPSVGLRVPDHPLALQLLQEAGRPIAAPSANPSGRISPTTPVHVLDGLEGRIDAVLDGGACPVGLESTILGVDGDRVRLLRPGGVPLEALEACLGREIPAALLDDGIEAPGQLASHYAPIATVRLNAEAAREGEVLLGFGAHKGTLSLSASGDLIEAAANLYAHLRTLDALGQPIAVAPVPETGLGRAINDRLRRAAAPKPQA